MNDQPRIFYGCEFPIKDYYDGNLKREEIILQYAPLVIKISKRYYSPGAEKNDLIQSGCVGLIKAVDKYQNQCEFIAFAVKYITHEMSREVKKTWKICSLDNDIEESKKPEGIEDILDELPYEYAWLLRRLYDIPETIKNPKVRVVGNGKRTSLPIHCKGEWSISKIAKKLGWTNKRVIEVKDKILKYLKRKCEN
jgi:RNA polymerase sigma factor (sigma-70 family)